MTPEKRSEQIQDAVEKTTELLQKKNQELYEVEKKYSDRINTLCKTHNIVRSNLFKIIKGE